MFYLVSVLIGRSIAALDRTFSYYTLEDTLHAGERVLVSFGKSVNTIGFVLKEPELIDQDLKDYEKEHDIKLSKIQKQIDNSPLLNKPLLELSRKMADYYKSDLIKVLSAFLPPSLKPRDSALKKPQGKTIDYVFPLPYSEVLTKKEDQLYQKLLVNKEDGLRLSQITAKASLKNLLSKQACEVRAVPVSRIPLMEAKKIKDVDLTLEQQEVYDTVLSSDKKVFLLQGVTGSGKTEVYLKLSQEMLKQGKGVLILIPEIALTDRMADLFYSHFKDTVSILNSSLSDSRKYDEYQRIASGESKVVLGTRSAIFAPIDNLGLILIDEEHSSSYKQDNAPYYDAIKVACFRSEIENCKVLLGSATPRVIDKARAERNIYQPLFLLRRYAKNQDKEISFVDMNQTKNIDLRLSNLVSLPLMEEIKKNLANKEQSMILLNRRGYSPVYVCRSCHQVAKCPNCKIPLNYHKKQGTLLCHHCGYRVYKSDYTCSCKSHDFLELGYGTERAYEELRFLFPNAKIYRLDSDVSSNDTRHEILSDFSLGEADILVGTEVIAKGHDFPNVTLAAILDCDYTLRLPTYLANEETFDLISQFVGRAGRADKKGRVLLQTYVPDNRVIQLASKQDYETFYKEEMEERRKYQYPPYTYLTSLVIKGLDKKRSEEVAFGVAKYLNDNVADRKVNIYGPSTPYIPYLNGRYYWSILLKYKSIEEISPLLDGIKAFRIANKDVDIQINVDPGRESL